MRMIKNVRYITNIKNNIHTVENVCIKYHNKGENIFNICKYEPHMCKTYLSYDNRFNISEQRKNLYKNRISKYMYLKRNNTYEDIKYLFLYIEFDKKVFKHFFEDSLPQKSISLQILTKLNYLLILKKLLNDKIKNDRTLKRCIHYICNNNNIASNYNKDCDNNVIHTCIEQHTSKNKTKNININVNVNTNICRNNDNFNYINNLKNTYEIYKNDENKDILINNNNNNNNNNNDYIYKNDMNNIYSFSNSYDVNIHSNNMLEENSLYDTLNKYDIVIYSNINNKNIKHIYLKDIYKHITDQINYLYMFDNKLYDKNVILKLYSFYEYFNDELIEKKKQLLFFLDRISEKLLNSMNLIDLVFIFHIHIKIKYYNFLFLYILINKLHFYIQNIVNIESNQKLKDIKTECIQYENNINKLKYDNISINTHNHIKYNIKWLTLFFHSLIQYFLYLNNSSDILINHKDKVIFIKHLLYNSFSQMYLKHLSDNYVYFTPINILSIYSSFKNLNIINDETLKCVLFKYINYSNILLLNYKGEYYDYKDKDVNECINEYIDIHINKNIYNNNNNNNNNNTNKHIFIYNNNVQIFYSSFLNIFSKFFVHFKYTIEEYQYIIKSLLILFDNYLILILQLYVKNKTDLLPFLCMDEKKKNEYLKKFSKDNNMDMLSYINEQVKKKKALNNSNNKYKICDNLKYINFINFLNIIMNSKYTNIKCSYNYDIENVDNVKNVFSFFNHDNIFYVENIQHNIKYIVNSLNSLYKITEHFINSYNINEFSKLFNKTYIYNFITKLIYNKYIDYNIIPYYNTLNSCIHLYLHDYEDIHNNFNYSINRLFICNYILNLYLTNLVSVYLNKFIRNIKKEEKYNLEREEEEEKKKKKKKKISQNKQRSNFIYLDDTKEETEKNNFFIFKKNNICDTFFFSQLVTNTLGAIQHMKILRYDIFLQISYILKKNIFPLSSIHITNIIHSYASFKIQDNVLIKYLLYKLIETNNLNNNINDQSFGNIAISLLKLNYYNDKITRIILNNYNKIISLQSLINITFYLCYYNNELLKYFLTNHLNYFIDKIFKSNMLHNINMKAKTQLKLISYQILYIHEYTSKANITSKQYSCLFNNLYNRKNIYDCTSYNSYIYAFKKVYNFLKYHQKKQKWTHNSFFKNNYILLPYEKYIKLINNNLLYNKFLKYHAKEQYETNTLSCINNMYINKNMKYEYTNQNNNGINLFDIFNYKIMNSKINMDNDEYKLKNIIKKETNMSYNNNNNNYVNQFNIIDDNSYLHLLFISAFPFKETQIYSHSELYNQVYDTIGSLNLKRRIIKELLHYPYYVDMVII
ncbi:conserved Plasmodium membrane protein, unknown function [Plasmodium sp. gorilla clade G2]|uniref:conserved Plasmodium membrane protein, unknown function n=1 Tax=Plasmodium sp. gorilla clade G2 TaxID=880535 RepID=UPI000D20F088|nr:conserved Plasmodium membrane protein, unknown function [Plasmodium sp. gorilla clade G2]SOV17093.1 conserved Plasmodium membrane protein, unknown function [Plasmodium sp. gorilla clade G2]